MTIRKRRGGWQVIVDAGLDPLTGKQRRNIQQAVDRRLTGAVTTPPRRFRDSALGCASGPIWTP